MPDRDTETHITEHMKKYLIQEKLIREMNLDIYRVIELFSHKYEFLYRLGLDESLV